MKIFEKLQIINKLKDKADKLAPPKDWDQDFLEKVKVEFTYNSNKIEGNTITYGQTVKLLRDLVTPRNASTGEVLDMVNHQMVLNIVFKIGTGNVRLFFIYTYPSILNSPAFSISPLLR